MPLFYLLAAYRAISGGKVMRYKERDLVIVNPFLQPSTVVDNCQFTRQMAEYQGEVLRVRHILKLRNYRYILHCPNFTSRQNQLLVGFLWSDGMLLPADELCNEGLVHLLRREAYEV